MGHWKQTRTICSRIHARKQKEEETRFWRERKHSSAMKLAGIKPRGEVIYIYILTYLRGKFDYGGGGLVVTERLRKGERSWNWLFEIRSNETRPLERLKVFCNVYVRSVQRYTEVVKLAERKSTNLADDCRRQSYITGRIAASSSFIQD